MCNLNDDAIKIIISKEVISQMKPTEANIMRAILFDSSNKIDWQKAFDSVLKNMPELNKADLEITLGGK